MPFLENARRFLHALAEKYRNEKESAESSQRASIKKEPVSPTIYAELHVPESVVDRITTPSAKEEARENQKVVIEAMTFIVVLIYSIFAGMMWFEMNTQNINQSAANNIASASTNIVIRNQREQLAQTLKLFELQERGWVGWKTADLKGMIFMNYGKSPALHVSSSAGISFSDKREKITPTWVRHFYATTPETRLNYGPLFPDQPMALPVPIDITRNKNWADVQKETKFLYFFGGVHYLTLDKWRDTTFCIMWVPNVGFDPGGDCSGYNSTD